MAKFAEEIYADIFSASEAGRRTVSYVQHARNSMFAQLQVSEFFPHSSKSFNNLPLTTELHKSLQLQDSHGNPTDNFICIPEFALFNDVFRTLKSDFQRMSGVKDAVKKLGIYLKNENQHFSCLLEMKKEEKLSEKKMQAVLTHHVFEPLGTNTEIILDHYKGETLTECPYCKNTKENIKYGSSSFGNKKLWHGRADMVIRNGHSRHTVTVVAEDSETDGDEPTSKKARLDSTDSSQFPTRDKVDYSGSFLNGEKHDRPPIPQVVSQAIVNAFLVAKQNEKLKKCFVPCFVAFKKGIMGVMYNVKYDVLVSNSKCITLIKDDHLAKEDILSLWIMLNFDKFRLDRTADELSEVFENSGFKDEALKQGALNMYENEMEENVVEETCFDKVYKGIVDVLALKIVDSDDAARK